MPRRVMLAQEGHASRVLPMLTAPLNKFSIPTHSCSRSDPSISTVNHEVLGLPPQEEPSSPWALKPLLQASAPSPYIPGCSLSQLQTVFTPVHAGRCFSSSLRNLFLHSAIHPFHNYAKRRTRVFLTERDRANISIKGHYFYKRQIT